MDADGLLVRQELGTCFPIARLRIAASTADEESCSDM